MSELCPSRALFLFSSCSFTACLLGWRCVCMCCILGTCMNRCLICGDWCSDLGGLVFILVSLWFYFVGLHFRSMCRFSSVSVSVHVYLSLEQKNSHGVQDFSLSSPEWCSSRWNVRVGPGWFLWERASWGRPAYARSARSDQTRLALLLQKHLDERGKPSFSVCHSFLWMSSCFLLKARHTFDHVHGGWRGTVAGVAHSPHRVPTLTCAVKCLHESSVEAHHTWITCVKNSSRSAIRSRSVD